MAAESDTRPLDQKHGQKGCQGVKTEATASIVVVHSKLPILLAEMMIFLPIFTLR